MKLFTIEDGTNNITVHGTAQEADAVANAERFRSEAGLGKIAADWPMARFVEIWNSLPGEAPVRKFKDRQTAVSRIWKAIQTLESAAVELASEVTNEDAAAAQPERGDVEQATANHREASEVARPEAPAAELPSGEEYGEEQVTGTATDVAQTGAPVASEEAASDLTATEPETVAETPTIDTGKCIELLGMAALRSRTL